MTSTEQIPSKSSIHQTSHLSLFRSKSTGTMQQVSRRLSSGSACETCRRRKTKCDGGQPCAFCASNRIECIHRPSRRKRSSPKYSSSSKSVSDARYYHQSSTSPSSSSSSSSSSLPSSPPSSSVSPIPHKSVANHHHHHSPALLKQMSCPSLFKKSRQTEMPSMLGKPVPLPIFILTPPQTNEGLYFFFIDQLSCRTFSAVTLAASDNKKPYPVFHLRSDFDRPPVDFN